MKKRIIKKIMALVLALTMVMGLSLTTFAATPSGNYLTVPVTITIQALPANYSGTAVVGQIYNDNVTINLANIQNPTAMDFIEATDLDITTDGSGNYIEAIGDVENYDEVYTSNYYKGYSWMLETKAGSSVIHFGQATPPSWFDIPTANNWFSPSLAATGINMNGTQSFIYDYDSENGDSGYTTSIEGIRLNYVLTELSW